MGIQFSSNHRYAICTLPVAHHSNEYECDQVTQDGRPLESQYEQRRTIDRPGKNRSSNCQCKEENV
jgi:hypothetical protein